MEPEKPFFFKEIWRRKLFCMKNCRIWCKVEYESSHKQKVFTKNLLWILVWKTLHWQCFFNVSVRKAIFLQKFASLGSSFNIFRNFFSMKNKVSSGNSTGEVYFSRQHLDWRRRTRKTTTSSGVLCVVIQTSSSYFFYPRNTTFPWLKIRNT